MNLTSYVDTLRDELLLAAEAGGDDARALAERLVNPLGAATRLALLEALSAAMDEVTRDLAPGSVEVRLRGRDPEFVVTPPPANWSAPTADSAPATPAPAAPASPPPAPPEGDESGTARITLRLPTHLKPLIDDAASRAGLSANAWLVRAVTAALDTSGGGGAGPTSASRASVSFTVGSRQTGWVR